MEEVRCIRSPKEVSDIPDKRFVEFSSRLLQAPYTVTLTEAGSELRRKQVLCHTRSFTVSVSQSRVCFYANKFVVQLLKPCTHMMKREKANRKKPN